MSGFRRHPLFMRVRGTWGRHHARLRFALDGLALTAAVMSAHSLLWIDGGDSVKAGQLVGFLAITIVIFLLVGLREGLYSGRSRYGSFDEVISLLRTTVISLAVVASINGWGFDLIVPTTMPFIAMLIGFVLLGGNRCAWRMVREWTATPEDGAPRVLVVGAGEGGSQLITAIRRSRPQPYVVVGLIDDDPLKSRLRISGVPVVGTRHDIAKAARELGAAAAVIAMPSAQADLVRELTQVIRGAGLEVLIVPPVSELLGHALGAGDVRAPTEADLLGRRMINTDVGAIAGYVTGRRVLVTGAGGSIGSELCRQLARFDPERLVLLDRDESGLHATQLSIEGRALLEDRGLVVADIRDRARVFEIFEAFRPHVVFHAAALKHLPLLELHPDEAVKTNVRGTQHVLDAALTFGVERFVNISTDKAADPTSVLGYTKRVTERLTAAAAERAPGPYLSVRFGNVLGSRGSVLTAFRAQLERGEPLTVTDPEVTRYFMTVEEAVELVIQAGAIGSAGEVLVLDMGAPVRIADVARQLAATANPPVKIVYTGLRPGEKLHEVLFGGGEDPRRSEHELIMRVSVPPLAFDQVQAELETRFVGGSKVVELSADAHADLAH